MERTDHGEHATPRRVVTPGPNIASVDFCPFSSLDPLIMLIHMASCQVTLT